MSLIPWKVLINGRQMAVPSDSKLQAKDHWSSNKGLRQTDAQDPFTGGRQNFERRNVERPIFRNFKIENNKITKDVLFDSFIIEFIFLFLRNYLNAQNI